jgi:flagellar basal-body rod protein FlgG
MQVISNNLANVNTVGFKSDRVNFESLLYQISRSGGDQTSEDTALTSSLALGTGVRAVSTEKKFSQGSMITTDNALDVALMATVSFKFLCLMGILGIRVMVLFRETQTV